MALLKPLRGGQAQFYTSALDSKLALPDDNNLLSIASLGVKGQRQTSLPKDSKEESIKGLKGTLDSKTTLDIEVKNKKAKLFNDIVSEIEESGEDINSYLSDPSNMKKIQEQMRPISYLEEQLKNLEPQIEQQYATHATMINDPNRKGVYISDDDNRVLIKTKKGSTWVTFDYINTINSISGLSKELPNRIDYIEKRIKNNKYKTETDKKNDIDELENLKYQNNNIKSILNQYKEQGIDISDYKIGEAEEAMNRASAETSIEDMGGGRLGLGTVGYNKAIDVQKTLNDLQKKFDSDIRTEIREGNEYISTPKGGLVPRISSSTITTTFNSPDVQNKLNSFIEGSLTPDENLALQKSYLDDINNKRTFIFNGEENTKYRKDVTDMSFEEYTRAKLGTYANLATVVDVKSQTFNNSNAPEWWLKDMGYIKEETEYTLPKVLDEIQMGVLDGVALSPDEQDMLKDIMGMKKIRQDVKLQAKELGFDEKQVDVFLNGLESEMANIEKLPTEQKTRKIKEIEQKIAKKIGSTDNNAQWKKLLYSFIPLVGPTIALSKTLGMENENQINSPLGIIYTALNVNADMIELDEKNAVISNMGTVMKDGSEFYFNGIKHSTTSDTKSENSLIGNKIYIPEGQRIMYSPNITLEDGSKQAGAFVTIVIQDGEEDKLFNHAIKDGEITTKKLERSEKNSFTTFEKSAYFKGVDENKIPENFKNGKVITVFFPMSPTQAHQTLKNAKQSYSTEDLLKAVKLRKQQEANVNKLIETGKTK